MDKILDLVAHHPWIDVEQIAALAGCSPQYAARCLKQLAGDGQVQSCQVFGLCTSGSLYALASQNYAKALLQIETLWGARNLLTLMAQSGELVWSVSPVRERFGVGGKTLTLDLSARGLIVQDSRRIPFVIKRDLGEVIADALLPTFVQLYRWSQSGEYRGRLDCFPVPIIVTINRRRAWQLLWLWQRAAGQCHTAVLPCYVGVWSDIATGQPAAWYRAGGGTDPAPLFQGINGLPVESVDQPPIVQSNISRTRKGLRRNALVSTHLDVPSSEARRVLHSVASWPLLAAEEMALLLNAHPRTVYESLRGLRELGLVETCPIGDSLGHYVSPTGIQLLAAACGLSPARYAHLRYWPVVKGSRPLRFNLPVLVSSLEHTRQVRAFFVSLARLAEHCRRDLALDHELLTWDEAECRRYYKFRGRRWALSPDSSGMYRIGDQHYEFYLEIDRGTASRPRLARKFNNYYAYLASGEFRRDGVRLRQVLIIVPDEGRARAVRMAIINGARLYSCDVLPAWIAVKDALDARGPGAPVWREITRWRFEHCFDGFRSPPESARLPLDLAQIRREVDKQNSTARAHARRAKGAQ